MTNNPNYPSLIDEYLSGTISDADKALLEKQIAADPELRGEFEFQHEIVNTLKEARKLELKTRLDNINIHWYHSIPTSWKIAAGISAITISTLSAYFYIDHISRDEKIDILAVSDTRDVPVSNEIEIPDMPVGNAESGVIAEETKPAKSDNIPIKATKPEQEPVVSLSETDRMAEVLVPEDLEDFADGNQVDMNEALEGNIKNLDPLAGRLNSSIKIESLKSKKYSFHYKFNGGSLSLYGNFEDTPYEILEINSSGNKRFFLKYQQNFYNLKITSEIIPLDAVTDPAVINELNIVKDNK